MTVCAVAVDGVLFLRTMKRIMSDADWLNKIIVGLAPAPISDAEFARRLAEAPEEDVDEETTARILAAEAEEGETISHGELLRRLGL